MVEKDSIPDVDLSSVQADPPDKEVDLGQFKTAEDLLKSYKEIQGAFTRVSQENKSLKETTEDMDKIKLELDALREQQAFSGETGQVQKDFDESWMENPEQAINQRIAEGIRLARIEDVLAEEEARNPQEYQDRYNYADQLAKKDPRLAKTAAGVKRLFQMADEIRVKALTNNSKKGLEVLFGREVTDDDIAAFQKILTKDGTPKKSNTDAYMPDGSTSTKVGTDSEADNSEQIDKAVDRGDVDGVLDEMFKDILA